jgi:hypothetical protein
MQQQLNYGAAAVYEHLDLHLGPRAICFGYKGPGSFIVPGLP